ncbi:thiamine diphosphokinase [Anaerocolumna sp. AGMB13020]|uniref:thiamine diphosphokinase n=1 Tax=Anaerocolumna sp. AGMB13020 TaxID=3081750 RepID=UPI002955DB61|nr:thiamine diphosphokinase [Anaerocolumna sp. AGMB13020]WOO36501.1 thiamine diphosphokinase [Anaerocolumna sp. AGMB13020]
MSDGILIITGGEITFPFVRDYLAGRSFDKVIAVDRGLMAAKQLNLAVDYAVGDFDSVSEEVITYYKQKSGVQIVEYNPMKDATDTELALDLAVSLEPEQILILGATGTRADHMLANIGLLYMPLTKKIRTTLIDKNNKIYMINHDAVLYRNKLHGPNVSLLPFTETVDKITLKGFKYPLDEYTLKLGSSIGISNEVTEERAEIILGSGILLVIEAKD